MLFFGAAREVQVRLQRRGLLQQLRAAERRIEQLEAQQAGAGTSPTEVTHTPTPET